LATSSCFTVKVCPAARKRIASKAAASMTDKTDKTDETRHDRLSERSSKVLLRHLWTYTDSGCYKVKPCLAVFGIGLNQRASATKLRCPAVALAMA